jgi:hypothetical protein
VIAAGFNGNHPQAGLIGMPAFDVLAPNVTPDRLRTGRTGGNKTISRGRVDEKRFVKGRFNVHQGLDPCLLSERNSNAAPKLSSNYLH